MNKSFDIEKFYDFYDINFKFIQIEDFIELKISLTYDE